MINQRSRKMLFGHEGKRVPQVFINGTRVGGLEDLERWAEKAA